MVNEIDDWIAPNATAPNAGEVNDWIDPQQKPQGFSGKLQQAWDKGVEGPIKLPIIGTPSLIGMAKGIYETGKSALGAYPAAKKLHGLQEPTREEDYPQYYEQQRRLIKEMEHGAGAGALLVSPISPAFKTTKTISRIAETPDRLAREANAAEAASRTQSASEFGIQLSAAQAAQNETQIRYLDMASRGAYGKKAQQAAKEFIENQNKSIQEASSGIGEKLAGQRQVAGTPAEAATTVGTEVLSKVEPAIADRAATEAAAQKEYETAITAAQQKLTASKEAIQQSKVSSIEAAQRQATEAESRAQREAESASMAVNEHGRELSDVVAQRTMPIEGIREAGEIVGSNIRNQAAEAKAGYKSKYEEVAGLPGQFHAAAFEGIGTRIKGGITKNNGAVIDDVTTPLASRAIDDLNNISNLHIQNKADPFGVPNPENIVAVDLRGVDQARKRLVARYGPAQAKARATGDRSDLNAMSAIMHEFDAQVEQSIQNGLFSGDVRALAAMKEARAEFSNYAKTYRPQYAGDDVGVAMRRIIERDATPEEIGNMIVGSGVIGNQGLPVRLANRLETIFGKDSDTWGVVRQAVWQKSSQVRNAAGEIDPIRSATSIEKMARSSLGQRMFSAPEREAMLAHANGIRTLDIMAKSSPTVLEAANAKSAIKEVAAKSRFSAKEETARVSELANMETSLAKSHMENKVLSARNAFQEKFAADSIGGSQGTVFRRMVEGTATPEEISNVIFDAVGKQSSGNVVRMIHQIEKITGKDSDAIAAIKQGIWQRLTRVTEGKDQLGQQKIVQAINEYLNGNGRTIAEHLHSKEELALMRKYADAVKATVIPRGARTNSDTAPSLMASLRDRVGRYAGAIFAMLGLGIEGKIGGLAGYAVGNMLKSGVKKFSDARAAGKVQQYIEERQPQQNQRIPRITIHPIPMRALPYMPSRQRETAQ